MLRIYRPRNERVILRRIQIGQTKAGVVLPDSAVEGKEYVVHAIGPKVEDLEEGDRVFITGVQNVDWAWLPGSHDLLIIHQMNVVLAFEDVNDLEEEMIEAMEETADSDYGEYQDPAHGR